MKFENGITIYESEKELYLDYDKHPFYNYPIKCKDCLSSVKIFSHIILNKQCLECDCRKFDVKFNIGLGV